MPGRIRGGQARPGPRIKNLHDGQVWAVHASWLPCSWVVGRCECEKLAKELMINFIHSFIAGKGGGEGGPVVAEIRQAPIWQAAIAYIRLPCVTGCALAPQTSFLPPAVSVQYHTSVR